MSDGSVLSAPVPQRIPKQFRFWQVWLLFNATANWLEDPDHEKFAVNIRFLDIYEVDARTPDIVLIHYSFTRANAMEGVRWCQYQVSYNPRNLGGISMDISATEVEHKILLKLLRMNSKLLPHDFQPQRQRFEDQYPTVSFVPFKDSSSDLKLTPLFAFLHAECQKVDWPVHKATCRSLKGGRWCTLAFRAAAAGTEGMYTSFINRFTDMSRPQYQTAPTHPTTPYPNVHGDRAFLVKLQVGLAGPGRDNIMVYDRKRSFGQVWIARDDDLAAFADLVAEMASPAGGYAGVKIYRWAKRTGDWELSICVVDPRPTSGGSSHSVI
ncbi:hypothetical protein C8Q77DRAFT_1157348 [Trametes polyzona]|nr:hypothetical protein C8Q77DRAFT_1157348 [Trametes polyzona]